MDKAKSKYYNTACLMNQALVQLLDKKEYKYITVKEICYKAGVNRSTFYLHYESMDDLLQETTEYILKEFYNQMAPNTINNFENINSLENDELYLLTPKYLVPYLKYIKENQKIFKVASSNVNLFGFEKTFDYLSNNIFNPILDKLNQPEIEKKYLIAFYINGVMAIVTIWLENDCEESIENIISIIEKCSNPRL